MSEKVVGWFHNLDEPVKSNGKPVVKFSEVVMRYRDVFMRNLHNYYDILEPLTYNPEAKYEMYYVLFTFAIFLYEEMGGILYDEDVVLCKAMLLAFIDQLVDDKRFGLRTAFQIGMYVFKGVPCKVPPVLKTDVDHVKTLLDGNPNRQELYQYMMGLGDIENELYKCRTIDDYTRLRMQSNCKMLWDMFDWGDSETVYALSCAGLVCDDFLDMCVDDKVYITKENMDHYITKSLRCCAVVNRKLAYDMYPYFPMYGTSLRALGVYSLDNPVDTPNVFVGVKRWCLSCWTVGLILLKNHVNGISSTTGDVFSQ